VITSRAIIISFLCLSLVAAFFHFTYPNIPDSDSFFYMREAWQLRAAGIFSAEFPWTYHSVIRSFSASLWYGFGVFLIPFSFLNSLTVAIKIAGFLFTSALLLVVCFVVRRHNTKIPFVWALIFFFAAPNVTYQLLMMRPQTLSLIFSAIFFSFLIVPQRERQYKERRSDALKYGVVFFSSFIIAWLHFNLVWVPLLILAVAQIAQLMFREKLDFKAIGATLVGMVLGLVLRPNALGALKLFYVQVVKQIFEKQSGLPLLFGAENFPLSANILFKNFTPFLIVWGAALLFLGWQWFRGRGDVQKRDVHAHLFSISSAILSVIFFLLTILVARRAYDFWALFGVFAIAGGATEFLKQFHRFRLALWSAIGIFVLFLALFSGAKTIKSLERASPPDRMREVAVWLERNSAPRDIVFNVNWSHFSPLFFWNQKNYYVGGLDPIFQYEYNPSLYWKFHYLSSDDLAEKTCPAPACTLEMLEDTHRVLRDDFQAKFVVLDKRQNPRVYRFLSTDSRFKKEFESDYESVFRVLPSE